MPAQAILGDAATARPSLIPFNPTVRARNRGRCGATKPADEPSRQARTMLLVLLWTSLLRFR